MHPQRRSGPLFGQRWSLVSLCSTRSQMALSSGECVMKNPTLIGTAAMIVFSTAANAQVTVDVAKITCDQFSGFKITDPLNIAIWLNGYYNGKRDNTIVDPQALKENYNKLRNYCIVNEKVTVLQAAQTLFGAP